MVIENIISYDDFSLSFSLNGKGMITASKRTGLWPEITRACLSFLCAVAAGIQVDNCISASCDDLT